MFVAKVLFVYVFKNSYSYIWYGFKSSIGPKSPVVEIIFVVLTRLPCFSEEICVKCGKMLSVYKGQVPEAGHMTEEVAKIADSLSELNLVSM